MAIDPAILAKYGGDVQPSQPAPKGIDPSVLAKYGAPAQSAPVARAPSGTVEEGPSQMVGPDTGGSQYDKGESVGDVLLRGINTSLINPPSSDEMAKYQMELQNKGLNKTQIDLQMATKFGPLPEFTQTPLNAAIYDVGSQTAKGLLTVKNAAIMGGLGELALTARGVGATSEAAKLALANASAYFAATGAQQTGEQTAKAVEVTQDPKSTQKDVITAWLNVAPPAALAVAAGTGAVAIGKTLEPGPGIGDIRTTMPEVAPKAEPINVTGTAGEAPPEAATALPPPPPPKPTAGGLVASIESVEGKGSPKDINAAVNEAIIKPPEPVSTPIPIPAPAPAMPTPAPTVPAVAPAPLTAEDVAKLPPDKFLDYVKTQTPPPAPYAPPEVPRQTEGEPLTIHEVAKLPSDAFAEYMKAAQDAGGGLTNEAHEMGLEAVGDTKQIDAIKELKDKVHEDFVTAMREARSNTDDTKQSELMQNASTLASKVQFFSEAYGAATKTGSAGEYLAKQGAYDNLTAKSNGPATTPASPATAAGPIGVLPNVGAQPAGPVGPNPAVSNGLPVTAISGGHVINPSPEGAGSPAKSITQPNGPAPIQTSVPVRAAPPANQAIVQNNRATGNLPAAAGSVGQAARKPKRAASGAILSASKLVPAAPSGVANLQPVGVAAPAKSSVRANVTTKSNAPAINHGQSGDNTGTALPVVHQANQPQDNLLQQVPAQIQGGSGAGAGNSQTPSTRPSSAKLTKSNAIQVKAPAEVDVRQQASNGQEVGRPNPVNPPATGEGGNGAGGSQAPSGQEPPAPNAPNVGTVNEVALAGGGGGKPPIEVSHAPAGGEEPEPEKTPEQLQSDLEKSVRKGLQSTVDVLARRQISDLVNLALGGDVANAKDLPMDAVQAIIDQVDAMNKLGREVHKDREALKKAERLNLMEQMTEEAGLKRPTWLGSTDKAVNLRPLTVDPLTRKSALGTVREKIGNGYARAMNAAIKAGVYLNTRDVELNTLDGKQAYRGFLSRYLGGTIDKNRQIALTLAENFRAPIKKVFESHKFDDVSFNRIGAYAIARQGLANRVVQSGAKASQIFPGKGMGPHKLMELTPPEQAYYDAGRAVLDDMGHRIEKVMREEFSADFKFVDDYWMLQRDHDIYQPKVEAEDSKIALGDDVMQGAMASFRDLFDNFHPSTVATPPKGFTIERKPGAEGSVKLHAANALEQQIRLGSHFLANVHDIILWRKIALSDAFAKQYGTLGQKYTVELLDTVARNSAPLGTHGSAIVDSMVKNLSVAILGLRILPQLKHTTNIFSAASLIKSDNLIEGFHHAGIPNGPWSKFLHDHVLDVYNRFGGEQSIMDLYEKGGGLARLSKFSNLQKFTFGTERGVDTVIARGSWIGAYKDALREIGLDHNENVNIPVSQEAIRRANIITRQIVTSPHLADVSQTLSRNKLSMNNATLKKLMFQFQTTMLNQYSVYNERVFGEGLKKGNYKGAAIAALAALAIIAGETYINEMSREVVNPWIFETNAPKPTDRVAAVARDIIRRVPAIGPISSAFTDKDLGLPVVSAMLGIRDAARHLITQKNDYGRPLSKIQIQKDIIDLVTLPLSLYPGVPGISTIAQGIKARMPKPSPGQGGKGNW